MRRVRLMVAGGLSMFCLALLPGGRALSQAPPAPTGRSAHLINLDQGWSPKQQQWFWFTSQGSRMLPYSWYLALEQAGSTELFRSDAHMDELRYILDKPSPANPDGLPVGFAKDTDKNGDAWVGFTCAACHSNQINYKGTAMRVDGAPTLSDSFRFSDELVSALQATLADGAKFDRFAHKVLGSGYSASAAQQLRQDAGAATDALATRQKIDKPPHPYGFARLDAFGAIFNQVLGADINVPGNYLPADAPVSYPFIWDTPQSDLVQWNGSAPNKGPGPLLRNVGEILGVYGTVTVDPSRGDKGYESSAKVLSLSDLEKTLESLWSPQWPSQVLPAIDSAKAAQGQALYQQQCAGCHALIDRTDPKRRITAVMTPVTELGTDPTMADNFLLRGARTGLLQGHKVFLILGATFGDTSTGIDVLKNVVGGTILGQKGRAVEADFHEYLKIKDATTFDPRSYKGRPLNGIWATAPYLHNGSVPNLWQLLQPQEKRVKHFTVGSREFDPVNVGFDTAPYPGGFDFDTTLPGNSNAGHNFGTALSDDEKWALVEYMKTL